jgi:hypothetical protein
LDGSSYTKPEITVVGLSDDVPSWEILLVGAKWLPKRPVWLGFVANTFFYAAILWLLIPGPFALRRLIRRRRDLCPKCAYPVGESDACTECGQPLTKRAVA